MAGEAPPDGKDSVRARLKALRRGLRPDDVAARGREAQARLAETPEFRKARTVALYAALPGEVPTDALFRAALADGKTVCFPVVPAEGRLLAFRSVRDEGRLVAAGRLRIPEPGFDTSAIPLHTIDLFVVPGLGFTRHGHRLGRGGGYYDATLQAASPASRRIALAFSEQVLDVLPTSASDVPVHRVVTEVETFPRPGPEQL
jgi:5-formyltetrahydrofolate cyclo-ligase